MTIASRIGVDLVVIASLALSHFAIGQENLSKKSEGDGDHYVAGRSLAREKHYEDAAREFQRAISINSKKALYYDNLGFCLKELRQYDEAIDTLNKALSLDQKDSYAYRELGICYYEKRQFGRAIELLKQCISLNPSDAAGRRWLGYTLYQSQRYDAATSALDEALKLTPNDFDVNYWRGLTSLRAARLEEASHSLGKAVELRPEDFNANFWRGVALRRAGKFIEAIPNFEKAHKIRPDDKAAQNELFLCYLIAGETGKAFRLYPRFVGAVGSTLALVYFAYLAILLPFSLRIGTALFPGLRFSFAWLALFFEGQIAFVLFLSSLLWLNLTENVLTGAALAGLPVIIVALTGFARQPWGEPFRWPLRFGTPKVIAISLLLLFLTFLIGAAFSALYVQIMHKPAPLQSTIPLIKRALQASPVIAWLAVAVLIPMIEEILFRGLLYGAFEKRWGVKGAMLGSSFLFACVHLQIVGFLYLFCIGLVLSWARWQSRSLGLPVAIHSLNNAVAMLALMSSRT